MINLDEESASAKPALAGDNEAIRYLGQAIKEGKHWYKALLEAMGLWVSAVENHNGRIFHYLIGGEAFDWLLLAERLCQTVEGVLPDDEKNALLFSSRPPLSLNSGELRELIGDSKYRQYLNYFYGVIVEGALVVAVGEEVQKGKWMLSHGGEQRIEDEAYQRIYGATKAEMLQRFRSERGYTHLKSITLTEMKEFTYWLFKYRLKHCEKDRVASDTKKALEYLKRQWTVKGFDDVPVADESFASLH